MRAWWWWATMAIGCGVGVDGGEPRQAAFDDESSSGGDPFDIALDLGDAPEEPKSFLEVDRLGPNKQDPYFIDTGCVFEYANDHCGGEIVKVYPNRCTGAFELEDYFATDEAPCSAGTCCDHVGSKKVNCMESCKATGEYHWGRCGQSRESCAEQITEIAYCDCRNDGAKDSEGRDPEIAGCRYHWFFSDPTCNKDEIFEAMGESCGEGEKRHVLRESYVVDSTEQKPQPKDTCGFLWSEDIDCVAHCKEKLGETFASGECVEEKVTCDMFKADPQEMPSARCKCVAKP